LPRGAAAGMAHRGVSRVCVEGWQRYGFWGKWRDFGLGIRGFLAVGGRNFGEEKWRILRLRRVGFGDEEGGILERLVENQ